MSEVFIALIHLSASYLKNLNKVVKKCKTPSLGGRFFSNLKLEDQVHHGHRDNQEQDSHD